MKSHSDDSGRIAALEAEITRLRAELEEARASEAGAHMIIATERAEVAQLRRRVAELEAQVSNAGAVKVKPLVWPDFRDGGTCGRPHHFQYFVTQDRHGRFWAHFDMSQHDNLDDAKRHCDRHHQRAALQPDPDARQADLAKAWQPIETAPRGVEVGGNNAVSWMVLAWPDGDGGYHRQSGMMVGEKFYAAPAFYIGGRRGGKHYELREIEIFPTHWMPDPPPPADLAAKIGGE